jgi:hypothetical protein
MPLVGGPGPFGDPHHAIARLRLGAARAHLSTPHIDIGLGAAERCRGAPRCLLPPLARGRAPTVVLFRWPPPRVAPRRDLGLPNSARRRRGSCTNSRAHRTRAANLSPHWPPDPGALDTTRFPF